jgi:hypothetical protein
VEENCIVANASVCIDGLREMTASLSVRSHLLGVPTTLTNDDHSKQVFRKKL